MWASLGVNCGIEDKALEWTQGPGSSPGCVTLCKFLESFWICLRLLNEMSMCKHLVQCLAHIACSVNVCEMNNLMRELNPSIPFWVYYMTVNSFWSLELYPTLSPLRPKVIPLLSCLLKYQSPGRQHLIGRASVTCPKGAVRGTSYWKNLLGTLAAS